MILKSTKGPSDAQIATMGKQKVLHGPEGVITLVDWRTFLYQVERASDTELDWLKKFGYLEG